MSYAVVFYFKGATTKPISLDFLPVENSVFDSLELIAMYPKEFENFPKEKLKDFRSTVSLRVSLVKHKTMLLRGVCYYPGVYGPDQLKWYHEITIW